MGVAQIVGLKGGFHTGAVLTGVSDHIHGERIAQASEVEVYFEMQSELHPKNDQATSIKYHCTNDNQHLKCFSACMHTTCACFFNPKLVILCLSAMNTRATWQLLVLSAQHEAQLHAGTCFCKRSAGMCRWEEGLDAHAFGWGTLGPTHTCQGCARGPSQGDACFAFELIRCRHSDLQLYSVMLPYCYRALYVRVDLRAMQHTLWIWAFESA